MKSARAFASWTAGDAAGSVARMPTTAFASADLAFTPAARLAELLRDGRVSARGLTETYLERIERLNPRLNAYRAVRQQAALAEADAADARLRAGERAPLLGVPVAVKDNLDVAGETATHGTKLVSTPAAKDCEAVRRLRAAGAVVLGLTTMPELALWPHATDSPTWGRTVNPYDATRSPGGSSGGSAVAVAAGLAAAALGTDGGGSIRVPAALNGLVGLKPQRDRLPLAPADGHWLGLTHLGVLTRTAEDAALLADALGGTHFTDAIAHDPGPLRIAVSLKTVLPAKPHPEVRAALERTAALLTQLGHDTFARDPDYGELRPLFVPRYLRGAYLDTEKLGRDLEPRARSVVRLGRVMGGAARRAVAREAKRAARINRIFDDADVVLTPATAAPAPRLGQAHHRSGIRTILAISPWSAYTIPWNLTGQPALAIPAGTDGDGVPLGVQLVARPGEEATILALAAQLERARPVTRGASLADRLMG
jgi:amidase